MSRANIADAGFFEEAVSKLVHDFQVVLAGVDSPLSRGRVSSSEGSAEGGPLCDLWIEAAGFLINIGGLDAFGVADAAGNKTAYPIGAGISAQQDASETNRHPSGHTAEDTLRVVSGAVDAIIRTGPVQMGGHILQKLLNHLGLESPAPAGIFQCGEICPQIEDGIPLHILPRRG